MKILTILIAIIVPPIYSMADDLLVRSKAMPPYNYSNIQLSDEVSIDNDPDKIHAEVYDNKMLKGQPIYVLDNYGLKQLDNIICTWSFRPLNLHLPSDQGFKQPCNTKFIFSGYAIDGTYKLGIIVKPPGDKNYYEIGNIDKNLYIDKKSLKGFIYKVSDKETDTNEKRINYANINKLIENDSSFKNFFDLSRDCIHKRDYKCLSISEDLWNQIMLSWSDYVCALNSIAPDKSFASFCLESNNFSCKIGNMEKKACDDIGLPSNKNKKVEPSAYSKRPKNEKMDSIFWTDLEKCFEYKDDKAALAVGNVTLKSQYGENTNISCEIAKYELSDTKKYVWTIDKLRLTSHLMGSQPIYIYMHKLHGKPVRIKPEK